jgi:hypothetical protein
MVAPLPGEEKLPDELMARIDKVVRLAQEFDRLEAENAPLEDFQELEKKYDDPDPALKMIWIPKPLLTRLGKIQSHPCRNQVSMAERRKAILEIVEKRGKISKMALASELEIQPDTLDGLTRPLVHTRRIRYLHGFYRLVQPKLILDEQEEEAYADRNPERSPA